LIGPYRSRFLLEKAQSAASFSIEALESETKPSPFVVLSPFEEKPKTRSVTYQVRSDSGLVANISMPVEFHAGSEIVGLIDMRDVEHHDRCGKVRISLIRNEIYEGSGMNESTVLSKKKIHLKNLLAKRFCIPITFQTAADFGTDLFSVNYSVEFLFSGAAGEKLTSLAPVRIFPPQISLSTSRIALNAL
jgi:hypothetical protein